jgi:hypothetical protein
VRQQQRQQFGFVAVFLAVAGLQLGARKKQLVATGLVRASALGSLVTHFGERDETPVQSSVVDAYGSLVIYPTTSANQWPRLDPVGYIRGQPAVSKQMGCCSSKPEEAEVEMKPPEPKKSTLIPVQRVSIAGASETENPLGIVAGHEDLDLPIALAHSPGEFWAKSPD